MTFLTIEQTQFE